MRASLNRRELLARVSLGLGSSLWVPAACLSKEQKKSGTAKPSAMSLNAGEKGVSEQDRRFLFVFTMMGGASINDSFMALRRSECADPDNFNCFPDDIVGQAEGTELRSVDLEMDTVGPLPFGVKAAQSRFLSKYAREIMVATIEATSVGHPTAQFRSVTGFDAWGGRTLQEAHAQHYGEGLLLPNINMGSIGYAEPGLDPTISPYAIAEVIRDPAFFIFGFHGFKGVSGAPPENLINLARRLRSEQLEPGSDFITEYASHPLVQQWLKKRALSSEFERRELISKLNAFKQDKDFPFSDFGMEMNPQSENLRKIFPNLGPDPLHNQAVIAYLLVTQGLSCALTFGLNMNVTIDGSNLDDPKLTCTPTGFDYSHNAHRGTQALLWHRTLDTVDRLITLLKAKEYKKGESYWDRSLIYLATEFGRDKDRPKNAGEFPSGHNTNNAITLISPLVNGGKVLGGIDKKTLLTYGFDPISGDPRPQTLMTEKEIYAGILGALKIPMEGSGLPDIPAMRKKT